MRKLILFLVRRRLHVRKWQHFQFANQKTSAEYYFGENVIWKEWNGRREQSHVSLNWIVSDGCIINKL